MRYPLDGASQRLFTLESLTAYQQSAMRNAVALVEEAQLLYEAGHYARMRAAAAQVTNARKPPASTDILKTMLSMTKLARTDRQYCLRTPLPCRW